MYIKVQRLIDNDANWKTQLVTSAAFMQQVHRAFYEQLPPSLWQVETAVVEPGSFRRTRVQIGNHVPPTSEALPAFLSRFSELYDPSKLSKIDSLIAVAAAHHRFL